jgi:hypothetical protein
LWSAELGDVEQALEVVLELDEDAEVGDLGDLAADDHAGLVAPGMASSHGSSVSCLTPRPTRCFSWSTSSTTHSTSSPFLSISLGWVTFLVHDMSETCSRPSMPGSISTKAP